MPKAKKMKRNSGEAVEVGEPIPSTSETSSNARKIPVEDHSGSGLEEDAYKISHDEDGGIHIGDIHIPPPPIPALTFDPTGPRMIITHIVNENFKSYAGVQYLGPFHKVKLIIHTIIHTSLLADFTYLPNFIYLYIVPISYQSFV